MTCTGQFTEGSSDRYVCPVERLVNHVRKYFPEQKVAFVYELGPPGYGLYDGLVAQAYRCVIASLSELVSVSHLCLLQLTPSSPASVH